MWLKHRFRGTIIYCLLSEISALFPLILKIYPVYLSRLSSNFIYHWTCFLSWTTIRQVEVTVSVYYNWWINSVHNIHTVADINNVKCAACGVYNSRRKPLSEGIVNVRQTGISHVVQPSRWYVIRNLLISYGQEIKLHFRQWRHRVIPLPEDFVSFERKRVKVELSNGWLYFVPINK